MIVFIWMQDKTHLRIYLPLQGFYQCNGLNAREFMAPQWAHNHCPNIETLIKRNLDNCIAYSIHK